MLENEKSFSILEHGENFYKFYGEFMKILWKFIKIRWKIFLTILCSFSGGFSEKCFQKLFHRFLEKFQEND
jgi:hypothetical protein